MRRNQQMDIAPPESEPGEMVRLHKREYIRVTHRRNSGNCLEALARLHPLRKGAAQEFTDHELVDRHALLDQHLLEKGIPSVKVIDPDRSIGEDHFADAARLRGAGSMSGIVPPISASFSYASRRMMASST